MEDRNVTTPPEALTEQQLLAEIREQNARLIQYVRSINTTVTLFGLLVLLAITGACALSFLNL